MILSEYIIILLSVWVVILLFIMIYVQILRNKIQKRLKCLGYDKPNVKGGFHGGTYFAQPVTPIVGNFNDKLIEKLIRRHNKLVLLFWIDFLCIMLSIVVFSFLIN